MGTFTIAHHMKGKYNLTITAKGHNVSVQLQTDQTKETCLIAYKNLTQMELNKRKAEIDAMEIAAQTEHERIQNIRKKLTEK